MSFFSEGEQVPTIDAHQADELVRDDKAVLVDYGEPHEWFGGHLPHAVLLSSHFPGERERLPRDRTLIIAARDPGLAQELVGTLISDGYDAVELTGGPSGWEAAGFPLLLPDGTPRR
jgi:rhodanese-related sulfurtransferase